MPFEVGLCHSIFIIFYFYIVALVRLKSYFDWIFNGRCYVTRSTKLKRIEKRLGLPEKPKRPATPYNRFYKETYPTLKDVESKKRPDVAREIASLWKNCDATKLQNYKEAFEKDQVIPFLPKIKFEMFYGIDWLKVDSFQVEYKQKIDAYKRQVTDAQLSALILENMVLQDEEAFNKKKKISSAKLEELGKPKRPLPPFIIFSNDLRKKTPQRLRLTDIAVQWRALNDSERKIYAEKATEDSKRYR